MSSSSFIGFCQYYEVGQRHFVNFVTREKKVFRSGGKGVFSFGKNADIVPTFVVFLFDAATRKVPCVMGPYGEISGQEDLQVVVFIPAGKDELIKAIIIILVFFK